MNKPYMNILVFDRTDFIFITVAGMVLCSGFVMKIVLTTWGWFSYCRAGLAQHYGALCSSPPHQGAGCGYTKGWEGAQLDS